jgi:hypothetical protein
MFLPEDAIVPMLVLLLTIGGLCIVVGARRVGFGLVATAVTFPLISALVEALFNDFFASLPAQLITPVAWAIMLIAYLLAFGAIMVFVLGEKGWSRTKSNLATDAIEGVFRLAFSWPLLICWGLLGTYLWFR